MLNGIDHCTPSVAYAPSACGKNADVSYFADSAHAWVGTMLLVSIICCTMYSGICTMSGRLSVLLCRYLSMVSS